MGAIVGAILTIPPAAFVLSPIIKTDLLSESDVGSGWVEVASVSEVSAEEPSHFKVEFPLEQTYGERAIQKEFPNSGKSTMKYKLDNAIWLSWKAPIKEQGRQGSNGDIIGKPERPAILDKKSEGFTESERNEIMSQLNVLSNSCAHLGCPVRWFSEKQLFLCEPVPKRGAWLYTLGSQVLFTITLQFLTGILLSFSYEPITDVTSNSV